MRIDLVNRTVTGRDGLAHPLDRCVLAGDAMYFARHGAADPRIAYQERWVLPAQGWVVIRWTLHEGAEPTGFDWYVDIDRVDTGEGQWTVTDRYLDLIAREHNGYEVLDADELAEAVESAAITVAEAVATLRALESLCSGLRRHDFSMRALLAEVAPGLPR